MRLNLSYGAGSIEATIDWGRRLGVLDIAETPDLPDVEAAVRRALTHPIGLDRGLPEIVKPGERMAIVVSDSFRKTGSPHYLPVVLDTLAGAGVREQDIFFVYATGSHRGPTPAEQEQILGPAVYARFKDRAFTHDPRDETNLTELGLTSRGTRVRINKRVVDADRVIVTGAVVLHYFGGYGGGRKSVVPGLAAIDTISSNHAMNLHPTDDTLNPAVRIGALEGNPVAEDMLEAAKFVKVDYLLNTVLNRRGKIAGVFGGELEAAHRAAAHFAHGLFTLDIGERADLVIAASGPQRNFVQTHKALFNAYQAVKPDGRIILVAKCEEGLGGEQFVKWLRLGSREAIIAGLRKNSEINGQTALSSIQKGPITIMVTDMSAEDVALLGARKAETLDAALELARDELAGARRADPTYYVMPSAAYTVPFPAGERIPAPEAPVGV